MKKFIIFLLIPIFLTSPVYALTTDFYTVQPDSSAVYKMESKNGEAVARPAGNGLASQKFEITNIGNETYTIGSGETGGLYVLTGTKFSKYNKQDDQKWKIIENDNNTYSFLNLASDKYLTFMGGAKTFEEKDKGERQNFILKPAKETSYTVKFTDGFGKNVYEKAKKGESVKAPEFSRKGHTLTGWDKDFSNIKSNMTVTAIWQKNPTVTFTDGNGKTIKKEIIGYGKAATAPKAPAREGYVFIGWDKTFDKITDNLTVNAKWLSSTQTSLVLNTGDVKRIPVEAALYTSSDTDIATVTKDGIITAKKEGEAIITAIIGDIKIHFKLTVQNLDFAVKSETICIGETKKITAAPVAVYSSSDKTVATVASDGTVKGLKEGSCLIRAKHNDKEVSYILIVKETNLKANAYIYVYSGNTMPLDATSNMPITYSIEDKTIATVDKNGNVKGVREGETTAIITSGKVVKTCIVKVRESTLNFSYEHSEVFVDDEILMRAFTYPTNAISYKVSDTKIATIDENGKLKGIKPGKVTVTASSNEKTIKREVTIKPITMDFTESAAIIYVGDKVDCKAKTTPVRRVTYTSSNPSVATVDTSGKVTGVKAGITTITTTAGGVTKKRTVNVKDIDIAFKRYDTVTVRLGETVSVIPDTTPYRSNIEMSVSNTNIATISGWVVTPKKTGKTTITAKYGGAKATVILEVLEKKTVINNRESVMYLGESLPLDIQNATQVTSSDPTVAICDKKGNISLLKEGYTTITASNNSSQDTLFLIVKSDKPQYVNVSIQANGKVLYVDGYNKNTVSAKDANNNNANKKFRLKKSVNNYYIHSTLGDGTKVLADTGKLQTETFSGSNAQKWYITVRKAGTYIQNVSTKKYLTPSGMSSTATPLTLPVVSTSTLMDLTPTKINDGWYTFNDSSTGKNIDVPNSKSDNGLQLIEYAVNNGNPQKFYIKNIGGYDYKILTANNKVLDVYNGDIGGNIIQWSDNNGVNQKWRFFKTSSGYQIMNLQTGQCLGVSNDKMIDKIYPSNYYKLTAVNDPSFGSPPTGWVEISPKNNTGIRFDVANNDAHEDTNIGFWTNNGNNAQKYYIQGIGGGKYKLGTGSTFGKRYLTALSDGNVKQMNASESTYQQWYIYKTRDGLYEFKNVATNKNLDVPGGDAKAGANLQTYADNDTAAQRFNIYTTSNPTGSAYYPITYKRKWNYVVRNNLDTVQKEVFDEALKNLNSDNTALEVGKGKVTTEYSASRIISALNNQYYYQAVYYSGSGYISTPISECYKYNANNKSIVINAKKCRKTFQNTKAIENKIQSIANSIFYSGMTERQVVKAANDWIVKNLKYKIHHDLNYFATKNEAECEGYSRVFELLMDIAGVDAKYVSGYSSPFTKNDGHGWSYVNVEDTWYYLDTCWNQSTSGQYYLTTKLWSDHKESSKYYNY